MAVSRAASPKSLGQMLIEAKLVTSNQWQQAVELQQVDGRKIEQILVDQDLVSAQQIALFMSMHLNIPFVSLARKEVDPKALVLVSEELARKYNVIPLDVTDGALVVAMDDPVDLQAIEDLEAVTQKRIEPVISVREEIEEAIDTYYRSSGEIEEQLSQIPLSIQRGEAEDAATSAEAIAQAPVVRALDLITRQALRDRSSDIHLEPQENRLRVRYRIDGTLHEIMSLPMSVHPALVSRVKIVAGMNIAEHRRPQDGQFSFTAGDREIDVRVATSDTIHGEMVVMRLLDKTFAFRELPELGFLPSTLEKFQKSLNSPWGMILISGPTGAGKTTTLYASVNQLDCVGRNIITIEDPVEYHFNNINQMPVKPAAGVTFATGLRACMRLDPDIILVGEIRDKETAEISVQAALTGHLVLSSVHANDTVGTIFRLMDLGVEPFLIASSVIGIVAQRMVRRVCTNCRRPVPANPEEKLIFEQEMGESRDEFLYGAGCNACANTGYLGRTGIFEVMELNESIKRMILNNEGADAIRHQAVEDGMVSIYKDGMMKAMMGVTTPYEVAKNVYQTG